MSDGQVQLPRLNQQLQKYFQLLCTKKILTAVKFDKALSKLDCCGYAEAMLSMHINREMSLEVPGWKRVPREDYKVGPCG
jgi:hypothetical protein